MSDDLIQDDVYESSDLENEGDKELSDQELSEMSSVGEKVEGEVEETEEPIEAPPPGDPFTNALAQTLQQQAPVNPQEQLATEYQPEYSPYGGSPADPYQENSELDYSEQEILSQAAQVGTMGKEGFNQSVAFVKDQLDDPQFCREIIRMGKGDPAQIAKLLYQTGKIARQKAVDEQVLKDNRLTARAIANPINQPGTMNQSGRNRPNPFAKRDFSNMTMGEASKLLEQAHKAGPDAVAKLIGEA